MLSCKLPIMDVIYQYYKLPGMKLAMCQLCLFLL